ncbi:MAG TPA: nucleotidyl transferase AbiEii/AbiGii toxin family protein [Verrucomicrobiae bacterium]|nr:nucleotidyl transferase AbiEii/AbiGii toxin family protein [Verrucomicrobiae bacterium]
MNRESREQWINAILNEVFLAVIAWEPLRNALIFKGARILNLHLGDSRQSLDIDSNIAPELVASTPDLGAQASFLEEQIPPALRRHFERQNPVKFKLGRVNVDRRPPKGHLRGWNAFQLRIEVQDNSLAGVQGLPMLEIDVAAPETLGPHAVQIFEVQGIPAKVYTLHRIAGEKLRAYLTSLPAYRRKMKGGDREFRVKDLHDIARILWARPVSDANFWADAGHEFQLACESRLVDCRGLESFMENWSQARERYETDRSLVNVSFDEAEQALKIVVGLIEKQGVFPLEFPTT